VNKETFYITTTLPYVNAEPHLGHALEFVRADIIARYKKLLGFEVFFNTGTDEHGIKIYRKALEQGKEPQDYVDEYAEKFKEFVRELGMFENVNFVRTTDLKHKKAAQEFWKICDKNGDIYKKNYQVKYCVGCELEKTESELVDGKCPDHPNLEIELIDEENYFFRFSKYKEKLLELYEKNSNFVIPETRFNEIKRFVERGPKDFSISRLKSKMPWGVEVPDDPDHVMYVWFDALVNYIDAIGWPDDLENFNKWWPVTQYAGKDNLRQQSAMWQAMLMSASLESSKQIVINGFILGNGGIKMSKSLGNVVDPIQIINEYGTDTLRFYLARHVNSFEDFEFTMDRFKEAYNADLANGLGNLTSRIMKMAETNLEDTNLRMDTNDTNGYEFSEEYKNAMEGFNIQEAANIIWQEIARIDNQIQTTEPFKLVKTDPEKAKEIIKELAVSLYGVARMLNPIMPETSESIKLAVKQNKMPEKPLFARKD